MAIESWIGALRDLLGTVEGIKQAHTYDDLPGSLTVLPSLIVLPRAGDQTYGVASPAIAHHLVQVTLYVAPQLLPEAYGVAVPLIAKIRAKLAANITLGGRVAHCLPVAPPERWYEGPGGVRYGDKELLGIVFRLDVKENESGSITVSA